MHVHKDSLLYHFRLEDRLETTRCAVCKYGLQQRKSDMERRLLHRPGPTKSQRSSLYNPL